MSKLSRRSLVSTAAALPALAVPAAAATASDSELRRLWSEYLDRLAEFKVIDEKHSAARDAFEAELPPCPDGVFPGSHREAHNHLWRKHGIDELWKAWSEAASRVDEPVKAIQQTPAETLFGIGIQLTALKMQHEEWDRADAIQTALASIDRLIGSDFDATSQNEIEPHAMGNDVAYTRELRAKGLLS
jgi:hypothetical protein